MPSIKTLEDHREIVTPSVGDIENLRQNLEAKRLDLLSLYEHDVRVGKESTDDNADDFADRANNSYNRELMFTLSDGEREMLIKVDDAFARLASGEYGSCQNCEAEIGLARLQAVPWAHFCFACQEQDEQGLLEG